MSKETSVFLKETKPEDTCLCGVLNSVVRDTNGFLVNSAYIDFFSCRLVVIYTHTPQPSPIS